MILWGAHGFHRMSQGVNSKFDYLAPILSVCYLFYFLYDQKTSYFKIENGYLKTQNIFEKRISLSEIEDVEETENKFILKSKSSELQIDKQIIPSETLNMLKMELKKFNLI